MKISGIELLGQSTATNFSIVNGPTLPSTGNNVGELFYLTSGTIGLYVYHANGWSLIDTGDIPGEVWGAITGNLNDQTDLKNALALKANSANPTFTGTVSGITKGMVGLGSVDDTSDANKPISSLQQSALNLKAPINNPTFTGTVGGITKAMVGLGSVDNTSDSAKPISILTQAALDLKANINNPTFTGTVSGITKSMVGLNFVDNTADSAKPVSGPQQIALDLKANLASPTFTGTVSGITKSMVGLGSVDNTADSAKPVSTLQQTALDGKQNTLVSGTNIKTINGASLLGSGNLTISSSVTQAPTQIAFGNGASTLTGSARLTFIDAATSQLNLGQTGDSGVIIQAYSQTATLPLTISAGGSASGNTSGALTLKAGAVLGTGSGGNVNVLATDGGTDGVGGAIFITAGTGGVGAGGNITLASGAAGSIGGSIIFKTSSSVAAPVERFRIGPGGEFSLASSAGTLNQVLTSQGPGAAPIWQAATASSVALSNTQVGFGSGTNTLTGSVRLAWNDTSSFLTITGSGSTAGIQTTVATFSITGALSTSATTAGALSLNGGTNTSTGLGGAATLNGGPSASGVGGNVGLNGGQGVGGGGAYIQGGTGNISTGGAGGPVFITGGGPGGTTNLGGAVTISGGANVASGLGGGDIILRTTNTTVPVERMRITAAGLVQFPALATRIQSDFSNATLSNRTFFQTITTNTATAVEAIPNGTGTAAYVQASNQGADPTNSAAVAIGINQTTAYLISQGRGTSAALPLDVQVGGTTRLTYQTTGKIDAFNSFKVSSNVGGGAVITVNTTGTNGAAFVWEKGGAPRWSLNIGTTETGTGNTGSDMVFYRFADDGTTNLGQIFSTVRSTGVTTWSGELNATTQASTDTSTKVATTAFVQGSAQPKGGGSDKAFFENDITVTTSYTITTGKNAMSAGPITVANGAVVTVPNGSTWTVI